MTCYRGWRIAAASATGTSHEKLGTSCQDSHSIRLFRDGDGDEVLAAVVSDGAGSASQAETGSRLTCSTLVDAVGDYLLHGGKVRDIKIDSAQLWVHRVQEEIRSQAERDSAVLRDYACTMLAAVVGKNSAAVMQIGDGATVISDESGWRWVHWPQHGEFANMTHFVTENRAREHLAFDLCCEPVDEIAIFSDGIERLVLHEASKTVFAPFFDRMFPPVRSLQKRGLDLKISLALENYLNSEAVCDRTDDDKTLVLATRRAPLPDDLAPVATEPDEVTDGSR